MTVTPEQCREINRLAEDTELTQAQIGQRIGDGVSQTAVHYHLHGNCAHDGSNGGVESVESQNQGAKGSEVDAVTQGAERPEPDLDLQTETETEVVEDEEEAVNENPTVEGWNDDSVTDKSAMDLLNERVDISLNGGGPITVFDAARAWRRRRAIEILADNPDGIDLGTLAEEIAAREHGGEENVNATERKRVYVGLYQHHIEKLEKAGLAVVEDDRTNHLRPTEATPIAAEWIRDGEGVANAIQESRDNSGVIGRLFEKLTGVMA